MPTGGGTGLAVLYESKFVYKLFVGGCCGTLVKFLFMSEPSERVSGGVTAPGPG